MRCLVVAAFLSFSLFSVAQSSAGQTSAPPPGIVDSNDPLLQPAPLPAGSPSLIGGTVVKIDGIRNALLVRPFGGKSVKVYFDDRTHIYRDGIETTHLGIRRQDRVYVDTLVDGGRIFAKSIRVETRSRLADARGRLLRVDRKAGKLWLVDELSAQPVIFRVDAQTRVRHGDQTIGLQDLQPNSLIAVNFAPDTPDRGIAREISIYAVPGSSFRFVGKVTYLDLKSGVFALQNQTDNQNYEIYFDSEANRFGDLGVGLEVTVDATFDGSRYAARNVTVNHANSR